MTTENTPSIDLFLTSRNRWTEDFVSSLKPNTPTPLPEGRTGQALIQYARRNGVNLVVRKYEGREWVCLVERPEKGPQNKGVGRKSTSTTKAPESQHNASESIQAKQTAPAFPEPFDKDA